MTDRLGTKITRRALLHGTLAGVAGAGAVALVACGKSGGTPTTAPAPTATGAAVNVIPSPVIENRLVWSLVSTAGPSPRRDHSLTFSDADGLVYMFGGRSAGVSTDELWTFNPASGAWQQAIVSGARPAARFGHDAIYDPVRERLIIALGQAHEGAFFDDVWSYAAGAWTQLDVTGGDRPEIRYGAGSAHDSAGNRLLISHGFTDRGRFGDTWAFDLAQNKWSAVLTSGSVPIKRCLTRCLSLADGRMLMFGGQTDNSPYLGDFWSLVVAKGAWAEQKPSPLPGPRNLYGASLDARRMRWYLVSGNTAGGAIAETWAYDIASETWSMIDPAGATPPPRYSADAAIAGDRLFVFGGHDGNSEMGDTWALQLA